MFPLPNMHPVHTVRTGRDEHAIQACYVNSDVQCQGGEHLEGSLWQGIADVVDNYTSLDFIVVDILLVQGETRNVSCVIIPS